MSDLFSASAAPPVPLDRQIKAVERELAMRRRVYPSWVAKGRMSQANADEEIAAMEAVLATLRQAAALRAALDQVDALQTPGATYMVVNRAGDGFWSARCPEEMVHMAQAWKVDRDAALAGAP